MHLVPKAGSPFVLALLILAGCGSSSYTSSHVKTTASPVSTAAPSATPTLITTKHEKKLGTVLAAGSRRLTVYLFEADRAGRPSCTGPCAVTWPPVTGSANASAGARASLLGTTTRADGRTQVTYKGHPLYFYRPDKDGGDAYGQALKSFGAPWYTLRPSGTKLDNS